MRCSGTLLYECLNDFFRPIQCYIYLGQASLRCPDISSGRIDSQSIGEISGQSSSMNKKKKKKKKKKMKNFVQGW